MEALNCANSVKGIMSAIQTYKIILFNIYYKMEKSNDGLINPNSPKKSDGLINPKKKKSNGDIISPDKKRVITNKYNQRRKTMENKKLIINFQCPQGYAYNKEFNLK